MSAIRYHVTATIIDHGDPDFWREKLGLEPEVRLADYVSGMLNAGEPITKISVIGVTVELEPDAGAAA